MIYEKQTGWSRKKRDAIILVMIALAIGNGIQAYYNIAASNRSARLREVLIVQGTLEINSAVEYAQQLSRTGGSYTVSQLATIRQHLYAIKQLNALTASLYGANRGIVSNEKIDQAMQYLSSCESRLLAGQTIDVPLANLRSLLESVSKDVAKLAG
ncbi:MAG TPA: hypothetical protein PKE04_13365 [Clostridia bacterium]|nr:hypothetical protein [Clostridia bacterium]